MTCLSVNDPYSMILLGDILVRYLDRTNQNLLASNLTYSWPYISFFFGLVLAGGRWFWKGWLNGWLNEVINCSVEYKHLIMCTMLLSIWDNIYFAVQPCLIYSFHIFFKPKLKFSTQARDRLIIQSHRGLTTLIPKTDSIFAIS